jgi:hypothetical protein
MNKYICFGILLLINTAVFSNDASVIFGRSVEILDKGSTNITMLDEVINITLHRGYYEVDVTFDFYNDGPAENILLGFPVWTALNNNPKDREWAKIDDFRSYINGNLLTEYTEREESTRESDYSHLLTTKWFIREVTFPENSHTYSRVTYKAPYNYRQSAGYIYGTGRCWKGSIGKMTLIINHGDDITIDDISFGYGVSKSSQYTCEANGKHKFVKENVELEGNERIEITSKYFDIHGEYEGQFGHFWDGDWMWNRRLLYEPIGGHKLLTRNQIRLFINFFYAMHGYNFKNSFYKDYFQNVRPYYMDNTAYKVNPNFSENDFNEFERKNLDYLLDLERNIPFDINYLLMNTEIDVPFYNTNEVNVSDDLENKDEEHPDENVFVKGSNGANKQFFFLIMIFSLIALTVLCFFVVKKKK